MTIIDLYKYERSDGGINVSPIEPTGVDYTKMIRLIADEGMLLTNDGENFSPCADVESAEGWREVYDNGTPVDEATTTDLYNALSEMGVDVSD